MIDDIAKKIAEEKDNLIAQAFTMQIGNLLISNGIVPIMREYTHNDVKTIIDSDRYKMITKFGVAFEELDTTEHDKQVRADAIDEYMSKLCDKCIQTPNECWILECPFADDECQIVKIAEEFLRSRTNVCN